MEMKKVLEQEGREAKNLIAYHLSSKDEETWQKPFLRKPPSMIAKPLKKHHTDAVHESLLKPSVRVRSASTGRDKRSELQARYWALLFGNLQRAINEIYHTVESYENLSSCQETILVLENYIRDFRALAEWFKVSWDYDSMPQRRPTSLAWDVRKSNPTSPRMRAKSLSSPSPPIGSGKSSPCPNYSGKNSPCPTIEENDPHRQPRAKLLNLIQSVGGQDSLSPSTIRPPIYVKPPADNYIAPSPPQIMTPTVSIVIPPFPEESQQNVPETIDDQANYQNEGPYIEVEKFDQFCQTDLDDENLTLVQWREKYEPNPEPIISEPVPEPIKPSEPPEEKPIETLASSTTSQLDQMETLFLVAEQEAKASRTIDHVPVRPTSVETPTKKVVPKYSSVLNRSVAAATSSTSRLGSRPTTTARTTPPGVPRNVLPPSKMAGPSLGPRRPEPPKVAANTRGLPVARSNNLPATAPMQTPKRTAQSKPIASAPPSSRFPARSKTMIELPNNKSRAHAPPRFKLISRDDIASSSSTLKASNEMVSASKSSLVGSRTHLQKIESSPPTAKEDSDGWLTVKVKRRSSLHWANRFHQPTGYASLPSLNLPSTSSDPAEPNKAAKTSTIKKENKMLSKPAVSPPITRSKTVLTPVNTNRKVKSAPSKEVLPVKPQPQKPIPKLVSKVNTMNVDQRQKSDLTGLKLATLRREYMRTANRNKSNHKLTLNPIVNDMEALQVDINIQTNLETTSQSSTLSMDTIPTNGHRDLSASSCDEYEDRDDLESDEDQRKLLEEQESLERQILELQNTEIDVDTETDETDCETIHEDSSHVDYLSSAVNGLMFDNENVSLEMRYQLLLSDMSQGERTETLATLQAFVTRHPGRAQELHQKLSSPSRRRSLQQTLKAYQAKHARAQEKRDSLNKEKAHKIQVLLARVEDVKAAKQQLIEDKRLRMEERLQRAAENRSQYLKDKIRKAHDEEEKMKEIAFIKNLEAQNKRLDFIESCKEQEVRLLDLEQERQKKVEEKAAKEAAVEKRRLELELERQRRLEKMNETRREREQRIGEMQEKREKLRQQVARNKARDREERLLALQVQQQHSTEELQRKIFQKQQESARRHEENIEHIRQRALELSIPTRLTDETGQRVETSANNGGDCDLSSVVSDLSREYSSKSSKKRLKKISQKLQQKSEEYMSEMEPLPAYVRRDSEVPKLLGLIRKGGGAQGLERPLGQLLRIIGKAQVYDYQCFWLLDGLGVICKVIHSVVEPSTLYDEVSRKAVILAIQIYRQSCSQCPQIARHAVLGNSYIILCDALFQSLQTPDEKTAAHPVELSTELMLTCVSPFYKTNQLHQKVVERLPYIISYVVATGLLDVMARRCVKVRECVENHSSVVLSLLATIDLLTKFGDLCPKGSADSTRFLSTVKSTDLFGSISLLHSTVIPFDESIPKRTVSLAATTFSLLVTIANLDLVVFQDVLSDDSLAFQFLDVSTVLLKYCGPKAMEKGETSAVIVDLVATIGFFCANNRKNQNRVTSDQSSAIIKTFAKLPKDFEMIVFPTLITIIIDNDAARTVVGRDFDVNMLEEYKQSAIAKKHKLVSILHAGATPSQALTNNV